jgi:hypothetical protein
MMVATSHMPHAPERDGTWSRVANGKTVALPLPVLTIHFWAWHVPTASLWHYSTAPRLQQPQQEYAVVLANSSIPPLFLFVEFSLLTPQNSDSLEHCRCQSSSTLPSAIIFGKYLGKEETCPIE